MNDQRQGIIKGVKSRKAHAHEVHGADHVAYATRLSDQDMTYSMHLGIATCYELLAGTGYQPLLTRFPSFQQAHLELLRLTAPAKSTGTAVSLHAWECAATAQGTALPVSSDPADPILASAREAQWFSVVNRELRPLRDACAAVRVPQSAGVMSDVQVAGRASAVAGCAVMKRRRGDTVAVAGGSVSMPQLISTLNRDVGKQSRNMLERFQLSDAVVSAGYVKDVQAANKGSDLRVGRAVLCKFVVGEPSDGEVVYMVGVVRHIVAAGPGRKSGAKLRVYTSVNVQDCTAYFFAHPWAYVQLAAKGAIKLSLTSEAAEMYAVAVADGKSGKQLPLLPESEQESEGEEWEVGGEEDNTYADASVGKTEAAAVTESGDEGSASEADDAAAQECCGSSCVLLHNVEMSWGTHGDAPSMGQPAQAAVAQAIKAAQRCRFAQ